MKHIFLFVFAVFSAGLLHRSLAKTTDSLPLHEEQRYISNLIINADVTVVLVDLNQYSLQVVGNRMLNSQVSLDSINSSLVINCAKNLDLRNAGIIYIPVNSIRKIQINSKARVRSLDLLDAENLDIVINGNCELMVSHTGGVHITGTEDFVVDQTIERRSRRNSASKFKNNYSFVNF